MNIRQLILLARPKHYIKNGLIFLPILFSGQFLSPLLLEVFSGALVFSLFTSVVYVVNDINDYKLDRKHPKKKKRPIASGAVSVAQAWYLVAFLVILACVIGFAVNINTYSWAIIAAYVILNLAYSAGLKNYPIIDIAILATGFILRVAYGATLADISISRWLYLTVLSAAFYLGLGKRRNEILTSGTHSRKVNRLYTLAFLDKYMYVCATLALVFYSLWATDPNNSMYLFVTIPLMILLFMSYSLNIEKPDKSGDPTEVLLGDRTLITLAAITLFITIAILYL